MTQKVWRWWTAWLTCVVACANPQVPTRHPREAERPEPAWEAFAPAAFASAQRQRKLILLSVQANFCHWCHVMNATTYADPRVLALLRERFVTLRVDESERPDLAARYADWGWPATAILSPDAQPVVTLRGHRPADSFLTLLQQLVARLDAGQTLAPPGPTESAVPDPDLQSAQQRALTQLDALFDTTQGGWGSPQKYPFAAPVEHALERSFVRGEPARLERALQTLRGHAQLLDPVGGGMFQYSLRGVWSAPHYEKLASTQAGALLTFAEAYRATHDASWLAHAQRVASYVLGPLRMQSGAFAASQNADVGELGTPSFMEGARYYAEDADGRAQSRAPALDAHVFANLNGLLIQGLCALYRASGDETLLRAARTALQTLLRTHGRGEAFLHAADDTTGVFYLSDQVEMSAALWAVAEASADPALRERGYATLDFVLAQLQDREGGGFYAQSQDSQAVGLFAQREKPAGDNARLVRLLLKRARLEHDARLPDTAHRALLAQSASQQIESQGRKVGDLLLALEEESGSYLMFSIVGAHGDPRTQALYRAAYNAYVPHGMIRVDAPGQGHYPYPGEPAVYLCSDSACSAEITAPSALAQAIATFVHNAREN